MKRKHAHTHTHMHTQVCIIHTYSIFMYTNTRRTILLTSGKTVHTAIGNAGEMSQAAWKWTDTLTKKQTDPQGWVRKESWQLETPGLSCQRSCLESCAIPVDASIALRDGFCVKDADVETRISSLIQLHTTDMAYTLTHTHRLLRCKKTNLSRGVD